MREWVRVAWHIDGMPYGKSYLELTMSERESLLDALRDLIEETNEAGAERPKDMR